MQQVIQNLATGETTLLEAPAPEARPGMVLIQTTASVISAGTERMLVEFGRASYLQKIRQQPQRIREVLNKISTDGLLTTVDAVRSKLSEPIPLGYCNAGIVLAVGEGVISFKPGDRVASNGAHADLVQVPENLCAAIPDAVDDESAAFAVPGSIALQGVRLAAPTLGECFVVIGVGLLGLLAIQILRANGCRVLAIDPDASRLAIAAELGADVCEPGEGSLGAAEKFSRGAGVDGVLITASTQSNDPVALAAKISRKRGRIILVGVAGLSLNRADFYEKELSFQVSCSYGPGRYDPSYEEGGQDYPIGFVRWTEQRNFSAVLDLLAGNQLDVKKLITHRVDFQDAKSAYDILAQDRTSIGIVLQYPEPTEQFAARKTTLRQTGTVGAAGAPVIGLIGAGNYAVRVLAPSLAKAGVKLHTVVSERGLSSASLGSRFGFQFASSDPDQILRNQEITTVIIATRHNSHASFALAALQAGKNVFVEKPLAITLDELDALEAAYSQSNTKLMVGFNRRFSPYVQKLKKLLDRQVEPKAITITVNAGYIPSNNWNHDSKVGGGRIVGEGCHFIDLMRFLAGSPALDFHASALKASTAQENPDTVSLVFKFENGSIGTLLYLANGSPRFPKERIEVFCGGRTFVIDNFRRLQEVSAKPSVQMKSFQQDKGHAACLSAFLEAVESGGPAPIAADEIFEVSRNTILAAERLRVR